TLGAGLRVARGLGLGGFEPLPSSVYGGAFVLAAAPGDDQARFVVATSTWFLFSAERTPAGMLERLSPGGSLLLGVSHLDDGQLPHSEPIESFGRVRVVADLDGDGRLDVAAQTGDGPVDVFVAKRDGGFAPAQHLDSSGYVNRLTAADVNGDGAI